MKSLFFFLLALCLAVDVLDCHFGNRINGKQETRECLAPCYIKLVIKDMKQYVVLFGCSETDGIDCTQSRKLIALDNTGHNYNKTVCCSIPMCNTMEIIK